MFNNLETINNAAAEAYESQLDAISADDDASHIEYDENNTPPHETEPCGMLIVTGAEVAVAEHGEHSFTGACHFCGQQQIAFCGSQEAANDYAGNRCRCDGGQRWRQERTDEQRREENIIRLKRLIWHNLKECADAYEQELCDDIMQYIFSGAELVLDKKIRESQVVFGQKIKTKASLMSSGNIAFAYSYADSQKSEI